MITRTLGKQKRGILKAAEAGKEDRVAFRIDEPNDGGRSHVESHWFYMRADQAAEFLGRVPIGTELLLQNVIEVEVATFEAPPEPEFCGHPMGLGHKCQLKRGHKGDHVFDGDMSHGARTRHSEKQKPDVECGARATSSGNHAWVCAMAPRGHKGDHETAEGYRFP